MQELEKILEEIDIKIVGSMGKKREGLLEARDIIHKHMNDGWIQVEERLPEDEEMVLVTCQTKTGRKSVNRAWYGEGFWHGTGSMSGVIAWRAIPEPYQPEATEAQRPEWKDRMLHTFSGGRTYD